MSQETSLGPSLASGLPPFATASSLILLAPPAAHPRQSPRVLPVELQRVQVHLHHHQQEEVDRAEALDHRELVAWPQQSGNVQMQEIENPSSVSFIHRFWRNSQRKHLTKQAFDSRNGRLTTKQLTQTFDLVWVIHQSQKNYELNRFWMLHVSCPNNCSCWNYYQ